jgi:hypothetical protein
MSERDEHAIRPPQMGAGFQHEPGVAVVSSRELDEQGGSVGASGCSDRISNGTDEAGDGPGGDRSCDRRRCALWLCADLPGRSVFRVISRCTLPMCGRLLGAAVPVGGTFLTFYRWRPKTDLRILAATIKARWIC